MPARRISIPDAPAELVEGLGRLQETLDVPDAFPDAVVAEAERAASAVVLPDADLTDIPFVTIDPAESTDLDQALHLARTGDGYLVHYAIADVAAFVAPGGAIDAEARRRGETLYAPTQRTPLHPQVLSEGATSLLPDQVRPALVWRLELDAHGAVRGASVRRARVRSREKLSYVGVQKALDDGTASEVLQLLREVGKLREALEIERGGVSLPVPEQEVHVASAGKWVLEFRDSLPVEGWNAQISLMTGAAAAQMMLDAGVGILRTLPPAEKYAIERLRRTARALKIDWPKSVGYPDFVRGLDSRVPEHAAMLNACTLLFRGASYVAFNGEKPEQPLHAAMATPYAHVTAPLRRLVDRFGSEICLAVSAGRPVPGWVLDALDGLPEIMIESNRRAKKYERGIVDLVEALVLSPHVHERFSGTVIDLDERRDNQGRLQLLEPAVEASVSGPGLELGETVEATLTKADLVAGVVQFQTSVG